MFGAGVFRSAHGLGLRIAKDERALRDSGDAIENF